MYASSIVQNPGPLDPNDSVVRNETGSTTFRSVHLSLPHNTGNPVSEGGMEREEEGEGRGRKGSGG